MTKFSSTRRARVVNRLCLVIAVVICAPRSAWGQLRPLTLDNCVDLALGRSPTLRAAEYDIRAADESVNFARLGLLPSVSGALTAEGVSGRPTNVFSLLNVNDVENNGLSTQSRSGLLGFGAVSLNYNLFKNGSILGLNDAPVVKIARAQRSALVWTRGLQREQVIFIVTTAFVDVVARGERVRLDARRVQLCEQRVPNIQQQVQIGLKLPTDLEFAREQLRSSENLLRLARAQNTVARLHLAALLGRSPDALIVSPRLPAAPALPATDKLLSDAAAKHPGIGVQNALIDQQFNAYRSARVQSFPQLSLNSTYNYGANVANSNHRDLYTGALTVSVPIFDFGAQNANKRAAQNRYLAEKTRLEKVTDDIQRTILDAYAALVVMAETAAAYERDLAKLDTAARVARSQSRAGLVSPLAAIDAELLLIDAQEALDDQRVKELIQFATLQNAAGGTWQWVR